MNCMTVIDPTTGSFEISEIPTFDVDEVTVGNDDYIYKSSARFSQIFYNTCLCRYPRLHKVVFENGYDFKQDWTILIKELDIKPILTPVKNPQANAPVE